MFRNREFRVNDYLTLKLEREGRSQRQRTIIYVSGKQFRQCKRLLLSIPIDKINSFDEIESIDEIATKLKRIQERDYLFKQRIPPNVEFWGHCSNLQMWSENNYDSRILHSNLAFPLLKRLTEVGDPIAKSVFREEIIKRLTSGFYPVIEFLTEEGYLKYFTHEEIVFAMLELKEAEVLLRMEKSVGVTFRILTEFPEIREGPSLLIENKYIIMLSLFDCDLKVIPDDLKSFVKIEDLDLGGNQFSIIPKWICKLKNLKYLRASGNKIKEFPDWIYCLKNLEYLDLGYNNISSIPETIGTLKNLEIFDVSDCPIKTIPESLLKLPLLKGFYVHDDFLTNLSKKILREYIKKNKRKIN